MYELEVGYYEGPLAAGSQQYVVQFYNYDGLWLIVNAFRGPEWMS